MARTKTLESLFETCLRDLHRGEILTVERSPAIGEHADDARLGALFARNEAASAAQAKRIKQAASEAGLDTDGPENIWMTGILDDAERDCETIAPGPPLDIALIGALRKAKQAEVVSYETAIVVAKALGRDDAAAALEMTRAEECAIDEELRSLQASLAGTIPQGPAR